jgi:hypothetical protein
VDGGRARLNSRRAIPSYTSTGRLPEQLGTGPRVLRTYRADDTMYNEHNTVVTTRSISSRSSERALSKPDVKTVHIHTLERSAFFTWSPLTDDVSNRRWQGRHPRALLCRRTRDARLTLLCTPEASRQNTAHMPLPQEQHGSRPPAAKRLLFATSAHATHRQLGRPKLRALTEARVAPSTKR